MKKNLLHRAVAMYAEGFRSMTVGRSLWIMIAIKLVIIFAVLKLFFFPDILSTSCSTDAERAAAVRSVMTTR